MGKCGSTEDVADQNDDDVNKPEPTVFDIYEEGRELGRGHFARVIECKRKSDGKVFAMKIIKKKEMEKQQKVHEEIKILRTVGTHKYIVSMEDIKEDSKCFYIIMELCQGGDLFSKIVEEGNYSELQAQKTCKQLAEALKFIHEKGITHRDLKPENILLVEPDLNSDIKVADFGLSKLMKPNQDIMKTVCGTWAYCAPEVLEKNNYKKDVDCWTLGVLMYILLSGYHPFDVFGDLNEKDLMEKIKQCQYDFDDQVWEDVSQQAKDLIVALLKTDVKERMTLDDFLDSDWLNPKKTKALRSHQSTVVADRLKNFNKSKFRMGVEAQTEITAVQDNTTTSTTMIAEEKS